MTPGTKLGPYEITGAIGAGGMGEVYRAHDPKLGRDVAIKVLPEAFARDAERMARFQREAKVLASLSHPNIATIYGLEDSGSTRALVMELVEGPTLADRIKAGPIPVDEAVRIARQIADALEYAHERGIIHRDLKPANVKVTNDDAVKVLDFGLAKALEGDPSSIDISTSPTISRMATQQGVLLGTAAYMSPEQAKAKTVDRRADIWAFGCVLYEMLTGKQAFTGETVTDTLASIIKEEPDLQKLPAATPMRVRVLLQRCLQKDPKQRLRDIGDARISLEEVLSGAPEGAGSVGVLPAMRALNRRSVLFLGAGALLIAAVTGVAVWNLKRLPAPTLGQTMRFEIPMPDKTIGGGTFALSPDGRKLVFAATGADGQSRLWVRSIDTIEARPLDGTEGATLLPIWSPDSRFIAFGAQGKLKKIEASGSPPVTLCDALSFQGGGWSRDGEIVFGSNVGNQQVSALGGSPSAITARRNSVAPSFLPDGRHFVYFQADAASPGVYLGSVDTTPPGQSPQKLLDDASPAVYTPSLDPAVGYLLFVRGAGPPGSLGTLMAQPFDTRRLKLTGEAVPIVEHVANTGFSASATDTLVYVTGFHALPVGGVRGTIQGQLTWFDREGKVLGTFGEPGLYRTLALSPDGKRVAFDRADSGLRDIWLYEFARGVTTRFTFDSATDMYPIWSPNSSRIAFASYRGGPIDLYQKASNLAGADELLFKSVELKFPTSWSPDGLFLLFYTAGPPSQIGLLPLSSGPDRKPIPLEQSKFNQLFGRFSPDERWVAYTSDESGRAEIYVRPFDASAARGSSSAGDTAITGKWMVSKEGGINPLWRHDGKELFYFALNGTAMAVDVSTSGVFQAGVPRALFKVPADVLFWDVSPDGKRFLMAAPSAASPGAQTPFTVVLNWPSLLKK
jgi:eukaryotic-like serine/threonine-protein kinase